MQINIIWEGRKEFLPQKEKIFEQIQTFKQNNEIIEEYNKNVNKKTNILVKTLYWISYMCPMILSLLSIGLAFILLPMFFRIGFINNMLESARSVGDIEKLVGIYILGFFVYFFLDIIICIFIGYILIKWYKKLHNKHLDYWEMEEFPIKDKDIKMFYEFEILYEKVKEEKEIKSIKVNKEYILFEFKDNLKILNYDFSLEINNTNNILIDIDKKIITM